MIFLRRTRRVVSGVNGWLVHTPLALALIIIAVTVAAVATIGAIQIGNNTRSIDAIEEEGCYAAAFRVAQGNFVVALVSPGPDRAERVEAALPAYREAAIAEADHARGGDLPCPLDPVKGAP